MKGRRVRPGRGWFLAGTVLLGLTGVAHTIGQFGADPPTLVPAMTAMRDARLSMGLGMSPALFDIFRGLAFTMSIAFFALTAINMVVVMHRDATTSLRRTVAGLNVIWVAVFIALNWNYRLPPPLISGIVIWPMFVIAYIKSRD